MLLRYLGKGFAVAFRLDSATSAMTRKGILTLTSPKIRL
ncbi:hypothetical protein HDE79_002531 [Rhodanobacter sp. MP1X3]|nr:hypothetical protein [Rhodanobacter sp. MP1X3]